MAGIDFIDFMMSFVDIANLLLYLSVVNCQKRKDVTGLKISKFQNFQNFQPGELLGSWLDFDLNLSLSPQQLGCKMYFWSFLGQNGA